MSTTIDKVDDKENIDPVVAYEKPNVQEQIRKIYTEEIKAADVKGRELFSEVQKKQEEISYIQKVIQGINSGINDKGELDLTNNPDLKTMLKEARDRFDLKFNEGKTKYSSQEWQLLSENAKRIVEDGNAFVQLKLNEVNQVNNKLSEIIKIFDSILKGLHHAIEEIVRGIK